MNMPNNERIAYVDYVPYEGIVLPVDDNPAKKMRRELTPDEVALPENILAVIHRGIQTLAELTNRVHYSLEEGHDLNSQANVRKFDLIVENLNLTLLTFVGLASQAPDAEIKRRIRHLSAQFKKILALNTSRPELVITVKPEGTSLKPILKENMPPVKSSLELIQDQLGRAERALHQMIGENFSPIDLETLSPDQIEQLSPQEITAAEAATKMRSLVDDYSAMAILVQAYYYREHRTPIETEISPDSFSEAVEEQNELEERVA
jgi:hypothetical protein